MRDRIYRWTVLFLLAAASACGCSEGAEKSARPLSPSGLAGIEIPEPTPKPDFRLTTTDGKPFSLRRDTDGYLTLLFFGYTHCPDVCPLHMANIAAVLRKLPPSMTDSIKVVVVTTDPARDTPEVLRAWLDHFDRSFIGLTGTEKELFAAEEAAGVMPSMPDRADSTGSYTIGHAAQVTAFTADNMARAVYPSGTRQAEWAHDIPLLVSLGRKK
ncbi:MAG: SCO family protein [Gemmatimonadales bacterium]